MKSLLALLLFISVAHAADSTMGESSSAEVILPTVTVDKDTVGGDILLINMKDYLVIQGSQSRALEKELGADLKKKFTRDIVMIQSVEYLQNQYGDSKHPITNQIINLYAEIVAVDKKRKKLD